MDRCKDWIENKWKSSWLAKKNFERKYGKLLLKITTRKVWLLAKKA